MNSAGILLRKTDFGDFASVYVSTKEKVANVYEGPTFKWTGGKIPLSLWRQIISFFLWSQDTHKSESLVQLFYNPENQQWAAWAFPQRGVGMTVSHRENDPMFNEDRAKFPDPWVNFGSVHHHCTAKAFASGTDQQDELKKEGIHITVGELDKTRLDLHMRISFQNEIHEAVSLTEWFSCGMSNELGDLNQFGHNFIDWALRMPVRNIHPTEWQERFRNTYEGTWQGSHYTGAWVRGPDGTYRPPFEGGSGTTQTTSTVSNSTSITGTNKPTDYRAIPGLSFEFFDDRLRKAISDTTDRSRAYRAFSLLRKANLLFDMTYCRTIVGHAVTLVGDGEDVTLASLNKMMHTLAEEESDAVITLVCACKDGGVGVEDISRFVKMGLFDPKE